MFLNVLATYGEAIWPLPLAVLLLAAVVIGMAVAGHRQAGRCAALLLGACWLWTGVMWHATHYAAINWGGYAYAALFVLQGALLIWTGGVRGRLALRAERSVAARTGIGLAAVALLAIPAIQLATGQGWLVALAAPVVPASLTILTLGLLLMSGPRVPWHLLAWPVAWSLIDGAAAWTLGLAADLVLPVAGLVALVSAVLANRAAAA